MREIDVKKITENIKEMCISVNHRLSDDMEEALRSAAKKESCGLGREVIDIICKNLEVAGQEQIPICQDTGMAVVFLEIGQDVHLTGGDLAEAVNEGVRRGYEEGYLRKSVVNDPVLRENTGDNTPAIIHTEIVPGDNIKITVAPKGFGSENMSRIHMLKPADGLKGIKEAVLRTVKEAGPNACPPFVVGVGIGGDFEKCAILAKKALLRKLGVDAEGRPGYVKDLERDLLDAINNTGVGPAGLGGDTTALGVNVEVFPTHIAGLPVAVSICCHVNRHETRQI